MNFTAFDWIQIAAVLFGSAFAPVMVAWYRMTQVRDRREEILSLLKGPKVSQSYLGAFYGRDVKDPVGAERLARTAVNRLCERAHSTGQYFLGSVLVVIPTFLALATTVLWARTKLTHEEGALASMPDAIIFALLGGYVWSVYELRTRIRVGDLTASDLSHIAFRVVASIPLGYVFSLLAFEKAPGLLAFTASAFPIRDLRQLLRRQTLKREQSQALALPPSRSDRLTDVVSGIGEDTLARFEELRITTHVELAYLDPLKLCVETGLPLRCTVDWVDQAILALYVGGRIHEIRPTVRTALEMSHLDGKGTKNPVVQELAKKLDISPSALLSVVDEINGDPHVEFLSAVWGEFGATGRGTAAKST